MILNGWHRLFLVLSGAWVIAIGVRAYAEYPDGGRFGGIPIGPYTFWSVVETPLGHDNSGNLLSSYAIEPKPGGFLIYGALPIGILWLSLLATRWVRRGYEKTQIAPSAPEEELQARPPSRETRAPNAESVPPPQEIAGDQSPQKLAGEITSSDQESPRAKTASSSLGWQLWVQIIVVVVIVKFFGLLGGLIAWGIWSLIAFLVKKFKA
jgi:hypothetical protein